MNTIEPKTEQSVINRIAGRMVHRANDITGAALTPGYLEGLRVQIAALKKRDATQDSAVGEKLADLEEREARLMVAAADYKRAEAILRVFPALLWAAEAGLGHLNADLKGDIHPESYRKDIQQLAELIRRAVVAAEEALK